MSIARIFEALELVGRWLWVAKKGKGRIYCGKTDCHKKTRNEIKIKLRNNK
jgi:hypothetical protein